MAIYDATQAAKAGKEIPLTCPFSGNRAGVLTSVGVSGHSFGAHDESNFSDSWRQTGIQTGNTHHLGVIREDAEMDMRDAVQDSMEEEINPGQKDEGSPHQSRAGSLAGSIRSLGSLASGINANVPAGSRLVHMGILIFILGQRIIYQACNDFGMAGYLGHTPAPPSLEAASAIFSCVP